MIRLCSDDPLLSLRQYLISFALYDERSYVLQVTPSANCQFACLAPLKSPQLSQLVVIPASVFRGPWHKSEEATFKDILLPCHETHDLGE